VKTFKTIIWTIAAVLSMLVALVYMSDPQDKNVKTAENQAVVNVVPKPEEQPVVDTPTMSLSARMLTEPAPEEQPVVKTPAIQVEPTAQSEEAYQYQWLDEIRHDSSMCDSKKHIYEYIDMKRRGSEGGRTFYRTEGWCKISEGQKIKVLSGDWEYAEVRDLTDGKVWWVISSAVLK
jgi:type IV secretory pathway VirB10-like protein